MALDQLHQPPLPPDDEGLVGDMSFVEHLGELRRALMIALASIAIGTALGFYFHKPILELLIQQVGDARFVIVSPAEGFTAVLRLSIMLGLFLGLPVILREFFWFVGPALSRRQRLTLLPLTLVAYLLFLAGIGFAYFVLLPVGVKFLIGFTPEGIQPMLSIDRYIGFAAMLIFSTALMFEVPVVMLLLSMLGFIQRQQILPHRRYAVLISFVIAAIITPSVDMLTQSLLAGTLIVLFEIGLALIWLSEKLRRQRPPEP